VYLLLIRFDRAVRQIFGKTVLCRTVEVATTVAHSGIFNCVTIDGIQVNKRGALTGGYHDPSASRLDTLRLIKAQEKEICEKLKGLAESEVELRAIDSRIAALSGEIHKEEASRWVVSSSSSWQARG
jgi:structural maintenance of chromosome 3 (chondroitin sulfate proteoglycan 6)